MPGADAILEEDDDDAEERPRHPYTWLHLIVLAVVAFVLGFLIVLLLNKASDDGAATASGVTPVLSPAPVAAAAALVVPT